MGGKVRIHTRVSEISPEPGHRGWFQKSSEPTGLFPQKANLSYNSGEFFNTPKYTLIYDRSGPRDCRIHPTHSCGEEPYLTSGVLVREYRAGVPRVPQLLILTR